ncbi:MAG: putative beta-lysine N-acetyltransferase [Planctomycetes bacterium]|nr:putative beta-lysine N-acetyltransferase [Planctomycetota bacterium]
MEKIDNSLVQHGPFNQRVYLMKVNSQDFPDIIFKIDMLAKREGYTKIFVKVPQQVKPLFSEMGYVEEAAIPGFYHGDIEAVFLAKYLDSKRQVDLAKDKVDAILALTKDKAGAGHQNTPDGDILIRQAGLEDAETIAQLFREVFESYPFPIHDPDYLRETMETHIQYFCAVEDGKMVAVSSSEMDREAQNVEMTDFATLPECRGKNLSQRLLKVMEERMRDLGMHTFYTIARALSPGMNITFARCGYHYGGTLTNNTNICGKIESMNVWYKSAGEKT